jgi:SSS family solute:Na+ symporter/sodium/pantothenate symporter
VTLATWAALYLVVYVVATAWLTRRGAKKTSTFAAYAASGAQLGVLPTALVAAACLTSTATFSINPGYVYKDGIAALIGFSLPVAIGVTLAFFFLGPRLRETSVGPDGAIKVLTLPEWVGRRFDSPKLRSYFAVLVLLLFFYAVLVLAGASYIASAILDVRIGVATTIIMAFVVAYTAIGGTHAHATTNVVKGSLLVLAAATMGGLAAYKLFSGAHPAIDTLRATDPQLLAAWREGSTLFATPYAVFLFPLVMGFALACQPHILVKVLYVKDPAAVRKTGLATGALFLCLGAPALLTGLAARAELGAAVKSDAVTSTWVSSAFPAPIAALLGVILIAVGIGTLNALLLALGSTFAHDVARPLASKIAGRPIAESSALTWGRAATVVIGALVVAVAYNPPAQVWITGSLGVYALVAGACPAVLTGCLRGAAAPAWIVGLAAVVGPLTHASLYLSGVSHNPNATGAAGVALGLTIALGGRALAVRRSPVEVGAVSETTAPETSLVGAA